MNRILTTYPSGKKEWLYEAVCSSCGKDRGYVKLNRIINLCRICSGRAVGLSNVGKVGPNKGRIFDEKTRQLMSEAKTNFIPWNKGKKEIRSEVKLKLAIAKVNFIPWNKGNCNISATDKTKNKIRHLVRRYIKGAPSTTWLKEIIGLSQQDLRSYIESKFKEGMTWENWTTHGWHLDHVAPLSSFNLNNYEELKQACYYTNLQPLWAKDNLVKSNN